MKKEHDQTTLSIDDMPANVTGLNEEELRYVNGGMDRQIDARCSWTSGTGDNPKQCDEWSGGGF